jgi:hypothetical protein
MGATSQSSPRSNDKPFIGRRRVSAVVAIPIVLMCGGLGFILGSVFPPESLVSRVEVNASTRAAPPAVAAAQVSVAQSSSLVEPRARSPLEAGQPEAPLPPAPEKAARDDTEAGPEASAPRDSKSAEETQDAAKGATKQASRRAGEKRKASPPNRAARAGRGRYPGPSAAPASSPGTISQVPIVGPMIGLFMP